MSSLSASHMAGERREQVIQENNPRERSIMRSGRRSSRSSVVAASMREVLVGFCRWTSVRGMPHVVRCENAYISATWATFVVIMCVVNMVLVGLLLQRYTNFNTIENIKRDRNASVDFPSVTVCNVDPVNTDRIYCLRNISKERCEGLEKFRDTLSAYDKVKDFLSDPKKNDPITSLMEDTSKIAIFYQLIGTMAAAAIGHQKDDFIIRDFCRVWYYEPDGNQVEKTCTEAKVVFDQLVIHNHFNCYMLSVNDSQISQTVRRLSMVLYLDEEEDLQCRPHCTHEFTEVGGGKALVHPFRTYPDIEKRGVNLLPGASNQLLINEVRQTMNKYPVRGSPCLMAPKTLEVMGFKVFDNGSTVPAKEEMDYTHMLCTSLEYQRRLIKECNCLDALLPIPWHENKTNFVFCGNINLTKVKTNLQCQRRVKAENQQAISDACEIPCNGLEYFVELTQLRWPQKPQILNHYKKVKDRVYFERKLKVYENIEKMQNATNALNLLRNTNTFEQNFLQMEVLRTSFDVIQYKEEMEYTLPTVLSQIGGICGIFLGFTFVTLLELVELMYRLLLAWRHASHRADLQDTPEAQGLSAEDKEDEEHATASKHLRVTMDPSPTQLEVERGRRNGTRRSSLHVTTTDL